MRFAIVLALTFALLATNGSARATESETSAEQCKEMLAKRMSDNRFWTIVDSTVTASDEFGVAQNKKLLSALAPLSPDEILGFDLALATQSDRAFSWDLWAVAYIANGGASDDGFEYFRYWLISAGRKTFETVLADPDTLADAVPTDRSMPLENELFADAPGEAWRKKTRRNLEAYGEAYARHRACMPTAAKPAGTKPALLKERFPKTWHRFGDSPLG